MKTQQTVLTIGLAILTLAGCAAPTLSAPSGQSDVTPLASDTLSTPTETPTPIVSTDSPASPTPTESPTTESGSDQPAGFRSCDTLERPQIEAIIGTLTDDPMPSGSIGEEVGQFGGCTYQSAAVYVILSYGPLNGIGAAAYWARVSGGAGLEPVPELPVEAWWGQQNEYTGTLYAMRGDIVLEVMISAEARRAMAIQIAQIALERIPEGDGVP